MNKMYLYFPEILFTSDTTAVTEQKGVRSEQELVEQRDLNRELLRVCQQQQKLLDEQSGMIVEMLEGMGK